MSKFNPEMLILAREVRGLSQAELANHLGITQGTFSKIENGMSDGTDYLNRISKALDFPSDFFMQKGGSFKSNGHFYRKKVKVSRKDVLQAEALMSILKLNIEKLLKSVEIPNENLPKWNVEDQGPPTKYAQFLREYWKMPRGRVENLTKIIEDNGILVIHVNFPSSDMDGLSTHTRDNQPVIFLNRNLPGDRLRFTLAHELGHIGMHFGNLIDISRDIESEAMDFASEFLVPRSEFLPQVSRINIEKLAALKKYWKVSMAALLVHAKKLAVISDSVYRSLWTQFGILNIKKNEPKELMVPVEKPTLIREIIDAFLNDLGYSSEELSNLLFLNLSDFEDLYLEQKVRLKIIHSKL